MPATAPVTARDLMQKDVLALSPDDSIRTAVASLEEYGVTGAPVVDGAGRLVGIFSASDVVRSGHVQEDGLQVDRIVTYDEGDEDLEGGVPLAGTISEPERVKDWMHVDAVTVDPDLALKKLCGILVEQRIHRLPVVEKGKLVGIVTTFDVVRHVAGSA